uniref:Uncharacterized protein n=1 Tax=Caenorhabditis japonica TaxID=281687 RepID=A0A8R1E2R0_CAEJA
MPEETSDWRERSPVAAKRNRREPTKQILPKREQGIHNITDDSEETCEILITSRRIYYSGRSDVASGTWMKQQQCIVPVAGRSMRMFVNCSIERFETMRKYCEDVILEDDPEAANEVAHSSGILTKTMKKTVEKLCSRKYEVRTEQIYSFPKAAKITFHVATNSDNIH